MQRRISLVLGKAPRAGTVVAGAVAVLEDRRVTCEVLLPHEQEVDPGGVTADLVVHRGLSERATGLVAALAAAGVPTCNPVEAVCRLRDRAAVHGALQGLEVPTAQGVVQRSWAQVLAAGRRGPVVVKAVTGPGRGRGVVQGPLPPEPPMAGPYLVEDLVENDGSDRKLYVAGDRVAGLLKRSPLAGGHTTQGRPFAVDAQLADLARATTAGLGLHLAGVDVVVGDRGPVVVDVNVFPGFRGVEGAARAVAAHLLDHLDGR